MKFHHPVGTLLCVIVAACAAGCGGGGDPARPAPAPARAPAAIDFCGAAGTWRELRAPVAAAALGRGPAVVFLNDSTNDTCAWMSFGHALAAAGRTAVVFKYDSTAPTGERAATRAALAVARSASGGRPFALVGASLGARLVFEAAARRPRGLAGIVSLSGERQIDAYRDILPAVRRVQAPVLYAGARQDQLTAGTRQPAQIRAALPAGDARFVLVPGFAHGTELLDSARVQRAVDAFLTRTLGG